MINKSICLYFQVHQPFRLRTYRFFDIGKKHDYYDEYANRSILRKVSEKCYLPTNAILLNLIKEYGSAFKVSFSISGSALDQFEMYAPDVMDSFRKLAETKQVEFLTETAAHSLSSLASKDEFVQQVQNHTARIEELFGQKPRTFRNTELIYSDEIGETVAEMGFKTMITEGAKHVLGWKSPNYLYFNALNPKLKVLLKNFRLSDDIAFRFSNNGWSEYPLTASKYASWLKQIDPQNETVNLFMDYETFGEHQWAETGIFDFLKALPGEVLSATGFKFNTPSEISKELQPVAPISVPYPISWADEERDLTAWLGNELQTEAFKQLYALREKVNACDDLNIQRDWLRLQNSDHFYYMCTKWFSDGEVHKYFNPYQGPYEAFINFMNVLTDFSIRVNNAVLPLDVPVAEEINVVKLSKILKADKPAIAKKNEVKTKAKKKSRVKPKVQKKQEQTIVRATEKEQTFDELLGMPKFILKELVKVCDLPTLCAALKGADEELKDTLLSFMGIRKLKLFEEEAFKTTKNSKKNIVKARLKMMQIANEIAIKNKK